MSSLSTSPAASTPRRFRLAIPHPAEGWSVLIAHAVVVVTTGVAMARIPDAPGVGGVVTLALAGMIFGLVLAKVRTTDLLAHLAAFMVGIVGAVTVVAEGLTTVSGSRVERLNYVGLALTDAFQQRSGVIIGGDQIVAGVMIGLMAWLVAILPAV